MSNNKNILLIAAAIGGAYLFIDKFRDGINKTLKSIVPESLWNVVKGNNVSSSDYNKLKLLTSMTSRDNIYSKPSVSRGEIVFPELLHEADAKLNAAKIIEANTRLFSSDVVDNLAAWGISIVGFEIDKPQNVLNTFFSFKNLSQLMQTAYWYNRATGKILADGINWMPENSIKQLYDKVNSLPTGCYYNPTNNEDDLKELSFDEFKKLMK